MLNRWRPCRILFSYNAGRTLSQVTILLTVILDNIICVEIHMPSFDIVSELDKHEVTNAAENAGKELERRYDLRDKASIEHKDKTLTISAEADFMLEQVLEIIRLALTKRKIDIQCMEVEPAY